MGKRKITSAKAWREPREIGYVLTLPSGNVARIRPVALDVMILDGTLPDLLSPLAAKSLWTETEIEEIGDVAELATGMAELFGYVCRASFLQPRIVDTPRNIDEAEAFAQELGEDEIVLADVSFDDKACVFQLAIQPAQVLRKFCEKQAADVESLRDSEGDEPEAE